MLESEKRRQSLAMPGSIMHISDDFWANSSKGEDAKPPVYGTLPGCDGIWTVAQGGLILGQRGCRRTQGPFPRQLSDLIYPPKALQTPVYSRAKPP